MRGEPQTTNSARLSGISRLRKRAIDVRRAKIAQESARVCQRRPSPAEVQLSVEPDPYQGVRRNVVHMHARTYVRKTADEASGYTRLKTERASFACALP